MSALTNVKVSRDDSAWEAEIKAEIPAEAMAHYRDEALKEIQRDAKVDGFRQGKAPVERLVQIYGEPMILRHAVEHAIQHELPELLAQEKLMIIEAPKVETPEPQAGKPLTFTARAPLVPQVTLGDYKKIAKKHNATKEEISVTDAEHTEALTHLRRERHRIDKIEKGAEPQKAAEESRAAKPEELPELDDMFVQTLGYENAAKFTDVVRVNIKNEKEMQAREKRRAAILDDLVKDSTIHYPAKLREYELDDMEARMGADLEQMGTKLDAYLTQIKKTREQLRTEWKDAADKRAKVRLLLTEIARAEKLDADKEKLDKEIKHAKEHYPQADDASLRAHITHAMRNEATLEFLEGLV